MKVSIITVAYNSADTIEDCMASVLSQDYPNIEYLVIDGKSTDETLEIVQRYQDSIQKVVSEPDDGIYHAMNKGLELCSGDVVGFLNSDDIYADSKVITQVVEQLKSSGADSCYGDLVYVDRTDTNKVRRKWVSRDYNRKNFLKGWMPPHPTFFLKRVHYQQYGGFNLDFRTSSDYELMLRMLFKHELSATYLNRVLVKMRTGGQSNVSVSNRIKANLEDRKAWKVNDLKPPFWTTIQKPLSKLGQFFKK